MGLTAPDAATTWHRCGTDSLATAGFRWDRRGSPRLEILYFTVLVNTQRDGLVFVGITDVRFDSRWRYHLDLEF
jgi:hypothetical protein